MEFKTIRGFENYLIGDNGEVYNKKHQRLKRPTSNHSGKGYLYVDLYHKGERQRCYIHRLVAEHFIDNPQKKTCVNHIDGNPKNNKKNNLEWCTHSENVEHAAKSLKNMVAYSHYNERKKNPIQGVFLGTLKKTKVFESIRQAERETGICSSNIVANLKGRQGETKGVIWCYADHPTEKGGAE